MLACSFGLISYNPEQQYKVDLGRSEAGRRHRLLRKCTRVETNSPRSEMLSRFKKVSIVPLIIILRWTSDVGRRSMRYRLFLNSKLKNDDDYAFSVKSTILYSFIQFYSYSINSMSIFSFLSRDLFKLNKFFHAFVCWFSRVWIEPQIIAVYCIW